MTSTSVTNYSEKLHQPNKNNTMSDDTHINMNSELIDNSIAEVCDKMDLRIVRDLSLCFNHISSIPNKFSEHLPNLERLDLSNNDLQELPSSFNLLLKLKQLRIDHNKFQTMPPVLAGIRLLKSLSISHNELEEISEDLGCLTNLEVLNLSFNKLTQLPNSFARLNHLRDFNLAGNKFEIIPEPITDGIRNLEILNVSYNKHIKINVPPCSKKLTKFYATKNGLCPTFPRWLLTSEFSALEEVNFDETEFQHFSFPKERTTLRLKILSITQSTLSDNILQNLTRNMKMLEKINIGNNSVPASGNIFWNVPSQYLKNPQVIKEIYMKGTGLPTVSRIVQNLTNITIMDFSSNTITWLPDEFCTLQKLEVLIINDNNLGLLPKDFGNLISLKELVISNNHLSSLPNSMSNLKELRTLDLYDNDLSEMPQSLDKLENLEALDIDLNYTPMDNLVIRNLTYEILRNALREKYSQLRRSSGARTPPLQENENSDSLSSDTSRKSEYYDESDEYPVETAQYVTEEEDWEKSDDSTEEYEPTFVWRKKYVSAIPSHSHYFCPEDLHAAPVKQQVRQMQKDRRLHVEEGQFDDA